MKLQYCPASLSIDPAFRASTCTGCEYNYRVHNSDHITLPTRICSTLIDQIYTNVLNNKDKAGIFTTHISDHQTIFTATNVGLMGFSEKKFITVETKNDVSLNKFIDELKTGDIVAKMDHDVNADPNSNYKILAEQLQYDKEKLLPTRKLKFNKYKHKQQKWVTNGILKLIKTKNKLYRTLQQQKLKMLKFLN